MNEDLQTLSKLFTEKLFRIPDYQRGYAWTTSQLEDYWSDLNQIDQDGNHYTGVITLEIVPKYIVDTWNEDHWIINSKRYDPFYVVDGQQRLTTSIILIQCISNKLASDEDTLNYTTKKEIQKKYLFDTKDGGVSRSYIFGYEKDNPSYEYLKTEIFNEKSPMDRKEETVYTNNLLSAKSYFDVKLDELNINDLESLYIKVTQKMLFNIFTISEDVDVCVAFETMNNRGKPLSYLELLKNRLIYLSIKLNVSSTDSYDLRKTVNECWKTIYHNLGRNKDRPLDDDFFLRCHHFINFVEPIPSNVDSDQRSRRTRQLSRAVDSLEYKSLLNEIFTFGIILEERKNNQDADNSILIRINEYSLSLQDAVRMWFSIFNPTATNNPEDFNFWLSKINKIAPNSVYPIVLAIMLKHKDNETRVRAFKSIEKLLFIYVLYASPPYFRNIPMSAEMLSCAIDINKGNATAEDIIRIADAQSESMYTSDWGRKQLKDALKNRNFYTWRATHYLLYEYNLALQMNSKTSREKIDWESYVEKEEDYRSIEHIYPQTARNGYWRERFKDLKPQQRELLKNVIGNLLPLSKPKNSSLSNLAFPEKVSGRNAAIGYAYGSYAENEVSVLYNAWTPQAILDRSLRILDFIEVRWGIHFGKDNEKAEMLGLGFVKPSTRLTERQFTAPSSSFPLGKRVAKAKT